MNATDKNSLVDKAILNTNYFNFKDLFLKGCRNCNKLVKHNHTSENRFIKESRYVYICECAECKKPLLFDSIDMYLLSGKV